ncbi:MAG: RNA polymerase sigma-70 factor [Cytophagales bacterium]|nr:RNA polymerase sigma-70 factor [Cytophagales bacterium]
MSKSIDRDTFSTKKLKANDPKAVSMLYEQYFRDVVRISYDIVKDMEAAKDIAQELFISIWMRRRELDFKNSMKMYLMQSARNQSFYYLRKNPKGRQLRLDDVTDTSNPFIGSGNRGDREMEFSELNLHIHRVIEKLPPTCKAVYKLSRNEKMSNARIAEHLNLSVKAVEKHITKAMNILRKALKEYLKVLLVLILG